MGGGRIPGSVGNGGGLPGVDEIPFPPNTGLEVPIPLQGGGTAGSAGPRLTGWPHQISWDLFTEVSTRPAGEHEDAQIETRTVQPARVRVVREQGLFRLGDYEAQLTVVRSNSWVVAGRKQDALLAHEQGHFDITGLVARDLVHALAALRVSTTDELQREVSRLYEAYDTWANELSEQYDEETDHSRNTTEQANWASRIQDCIRQGTSLGTPPA